MSKKNITFIKHIKPQIKAKADQDKANKVRERIRKIQSLSNVDPSLYPQEEEPEPKDPYTQLLEFFGYGRRFR